MVFKHVELGGNYSMPKKIIIDATGEDGKYEVMAMYENGEEIDYIEANTEEEAVAAFDQLFMKYAGEFQRTMYGKLTPGGKYTLVYLDEFGFPVAKKITFNDMFFNSYAQYSDVVRLYYIPFRKRNEKIQVFHGNSLYIFEGWQDLDESAIYETLKDTEDIKVRRSKYCGFDSRYMEDMEKMFKNPVVIWKNCKVGVNGKTYA